MIKSIHGDSSQTHLDTAKVVGAELDERGGLKHAQGGHDEGALLQAVQVTHYQQEVISLLHWQEP